MKTIKPVKAWGIKNDRKDGKIMLVGGQLPIFWLKDVAELYNKNDYQGKVVPVLISPIKKK
ncbi:MAG: hypothetical protein ACTSQ8_24240 [Candidatus Helarchaeota archaeon]